MANFVDLPQASRYKDTPLFVGTRGPEFGLMEPPAETVEADPDYRVHRVRGWEIGVLDKISNRYYGQGSEALYWFVQLANAIIDTEEEMVLGQQLLIPPRSLLIQFRTRGSNLAG